MIHFGGILGLDLAKEWGWAVVGPDGNYVASGHRKLCGVDRGQDAYQLALSISDLITEFEPDWLIIEKPNSHHYGAARNLFGYAMVAHHVAHIRQLGFQEIVRGDAYKRVVGNGHAKKLAGVLYGRQFKPLLNSDDESDAILVAMAGHQWRQIKYEKPTPKQRAARRGKPTIAQIRKAEAVRLLP
jgi:Holliday junction resolvasome RuvABC endonuclease subunit